MAAVIEVLTICITGNSGSEANTWRGAGGRAHYRRRLISRKEPVLVALKYWAATQQKAPAAGALIETRRCRRARSPSVERRARAAARRLSHEIVNHCCSLSTSYNYQTLPTKHPRKSRNESDKISEKIEKNWLVTGNETKVQSRYYGGAGAGARASARPPLFAPVISIGAGSSLFASVL
ncbi:hypothetical protein EVAR_76636_1 [Eumeta japonica]|uniref:Uncharacterized protein n=1 Tax=Eumeta variegata TaxID=151549 RepID=A0A4C1T5I1_EUMVA|nr:hypothetical protein EVAR_76636_1 [Eumeta japonica]